MTPLLSASGLEFLPWDDPLFLALVALVVASELLIPAWVYYDATKRGLDAAIWLQVTILPVINVLGLLAYLSARKSETADGIDE